MTEPKIKKVCMHDEVEIRWDSLRSADGAPGSIIKREDEAPEKVSDS